MDEKNVQPLSTAEFFRSISDLQKVELIREIIQTMDSDFRQHVINTIAGQQAAAGGEVVDFFISSDEQHVRMDFGKALAWFVIPKPHAIQLAMLLLQHGGAQIAKAASPEP